MTIIKNLLLMFIIVFGWVIFPILAHFVVEDWILAIFWGELAYAVFFLVQTALVGNQEYRIYKQIKTKGVENYEIYFSNE